MKGDTQFTRTKQLNDLYFLKCAISTHNFLKPEWINSRKTTISRKSSIFPNICHHKRQYFELLVPEIKCRYSTADLCEQIYANMLNKSYKTKSTVSGRRARWARTNSHASNIKRRILTQYVAFAMFVLLCELSNETRTAGEISIFANGTRCERRERLALLNTEKINEVTVEVNSCWPSVHTERCSNSKRSRCNRLFYLDCLQSSNRWLAEYECASKTRDWCKRE